MIYEKEIRTGWIYTGSKGELWERWRRGEQMKSIGRVFGKPSSEHFQAYPLNWWVYSS